MSEAVWLAVAGGLCLAGMGWLALSMEAHWGQVMHRPAEGATAVRRRLRVQGAMALSLALLACLAADRPSMATLVWIMWLTVSAVAVAMLLSRRPRWLAGLAGAWPGLPERRS